jgi:hypothetical protein
MSDSLLRRHIRFLVWSKYDLTLTRTRGQGIVQWLGTSRLEYPGGVASLYLWTVRNAAIWSEKAGE